MSRDGKGELITRDVTSEPEEQQVMACGYPLVTNYGGLYRHCVAGHLHCTTCGGFLRKYKKGWTHVCRKG